MDAADEEWADAVWLMADAALTLRVRAADEWAACELLPNAEQQLS